MMKLMGDDIIMMIAIFRCDGRAHQKSWSHVRLYVLLSLRSILFSDTCCWNHLINDSWETSAANGSCRNKDINSAIVNRYHFAFWELSDICDFRLNERTTHKKLYAHISTIFYCNCWYTKIYDFLSNQNRVPSIIVCQNESFYGKTSWLIVLKEKCCWNDLILKGGGKRRRTDRKHLQKRKELMPSTLLYF